MSAVLDMGINETCDAWQPRCYAAECRLKMTDGLSAWAVPRKQIRGARPLMPVRLTAYSVNSLNS